MHIGLNAHLLSSRAGYRTAGIHGYIYNLLAHLPANAPEDWRFTAMVGAANQNRFEGITMRHAGIDTESPIKRILWEQIAQPQQLEEFDLYHAMAFIAPLRLTIPSVVTVYDLSFIHYPGVLPASRRLYLRLLTGLTCQRAKRIIAISHSTARDVANTYNIAHEKIDVAACGYDTALFKSLPAEQIRAFKEANGLPEKFWLFVGTLEPRKNLVTLLIAYAALPVVDRLPLILGGGKGWHYGEIFATIEKYGLHNDVSFPGFIPTDALPLWYNSAHTFIYPSVFEGFGLPVLEAMACGTPVIVSNTSSLPEVVGSAGLQVPAFDIEAWTAALRIARYDDQWRQTARQQGFHEASRYHWGDTAKQTIKSYQSAL